MLKIFTIAKKAILLTTCFFLVLSCGNDDNSTPVNQNPLQIPVSGSYLRANVGDDSFSSRANGVESVEAISGNGQILITATNESKEKIIISLENITSTGLITVNSLSDSLLDYSNLGVSYNTKGCNETSGTVVVTAIDATMVEGTFQFIGKKSDDCGSKTITEGAFRAIISN